MKVNKWWFYSILLIPIKVKQDIRNYNNLEIHLTLIRKQNYSRSDSVIQSISLSIFLMQFNFFRSVSFWRNAAPRSYSSPECLKCCSCIFLDFVEKGVYILKMLNGRVIVTAIKTDIKWAAFFLPWLKCTSQQGSEEGTSDSSQRFLLSSACSCSSTFLCLGREQSEEAEQSFC